MTPELYWLTWTVAFSALLWIPYVANRFRELGPPSWTKWFIPLDPPHRAEWANRSARAHVNAVEGLVVFAPLAIVASIQGGTAATALACQIFFFARLAHALVQISGMPIPFRTMPFLVAFACQITLAVSILSRA